MANKVFDLEKKQIRNFPRKFGKRKVSTRSPPKSNQMMTMTSEIWLQSFVVIVTHFILQKSKFLFINVTAVTLGQGRPKVTQ